MQIILNKHFENDKDRAGRQPSGNPMSQDSWDRNDG